MALFSGVPCHLPFPFDANFVPVYTQFLSQGSDKNIGAFELGIESNYLIESRIGVLPGIKTYKPWVIRCSGAVKLANYTANDHE